MYLYTIYEYICAIDLKKNNDNMNKAWDASNLIKTLYKQIEDG